MPPSNEPKPTISQFEGLLVELGLAKIDFAVVGGVAVILNGYARLTQDLDILVDDSRANIQRMLECLAKWGEGWARELRPDEFVPQEGSIRISEDFDLDIFTRMRGHSLADFRPRLKHFRSGSVSISYISPTDLVTLKTGSWRDKDCLDVLAMQEVLKQEAAGRDPRH